MESGSPHFLVVVYVVNLLGEAGFPFPFLMESLLVFVGYELSRGHLATALPILAVALAGSGSGATIMYALSRRLGATLLHRYRRFIPLKEEWLAKAEARVGSARPMRIALTRLVPGLLLPVSLVAGTLRVPFARFALGVGLSEIGWVGPFIALGIAAGHLPLSIEGFVKYYPRVMGVLAAATLLLFLGKVLWQQWRTRAGQASSVSPGGIEEESRSPR